jgi:hypothetical protein
MSRVIEDDDLAIVIETDDFGGETMAHHGVPSEPKRPAMPTRPPPLSVVEALPPPLSSAEALSIPRSPLSVAEAFQGMLWAAFVAGAEAGTTIMTGDALMFDREVDDGALRGSFESWYGREVSG